MIFFSKKHILLVLFLMGNFVALNASNFYQSVWDKMLEGTVEEIETTLSEVHFKELPNTANLLEKVKAISVNQRALTTIEMRSRASSLKNLFAPGDECADVDFIDLRGVPGFSQTNDLNVCGAADTLSMIIFTGDPGVIKGFEFTVKLPEGIEYAGWEFAEFGGTSISVADPNLSRPTFIVNGITGDSLVVVNIGIRSNCEVDKNEMLFIEYQYDYTYIDTFNMVHNCSGNYMEPTEFNSAVHVPVLNMLSPLSPVEATITSLGAPACQTIQFSQDGLNAYLDSFKFEIVGLELFGGDLILDEIEVNSMLVPSGDISYDAGSQTTSLNVDGTYFPANSLSNPADNQMNTNEVLAVKVCYTLNACPESADIPFNYLARWGCDDRDCETTGQTSFLKVRPTGTMPATATATLNAAGIEICGNPGEVSITLNNPNTDTEQNAYKDIKIGFQTCNKPNLDVTNVVVGGVIVPSSYYTWVGDDISIDFTGNTDATLGLEDYDGDGFYDDMSGATSITAVVEISVDCGINSGECNPMECNDIQFYVDYKTNCGTAYKEFPDPNTFDLFYSADTVYNDSEVALNTAMTVFGHNFGAVSNSGAPIAGTGPDTLEVEFCYEFSAQNISECPSGPKDYLYVDFVGAPSTILDVQFVSGSGMVSTDGGATYVAAASESWSKSSDTEAQLILEQASTSNTVCFKYSMEMDSCLCAPVQYFVGSQKVVSVCEDCDPDCEIVKACRETTFAVDQNCTGCDCVLDHGIVKSERKNLGYTDKTMTTKHTRESLTDAGRAIDLGRLVPGDTLLHEEFYVIQDEGVLNDVSYWAMIWYWYPVGFGQAEMARLPLVPDFSSGRILEYSVSKDGTGAKTDIDLASLASCTNTNSSPYYGTRNYWNDNPWGFPKHFGSLNSAPDYWDNQFTYFHLFNYEKIDECGGTEGIRAEGNCLDDMIAAHNIEVGDTIWFSYDVPMIKNPQREALKAFGQEPPLQNNARIVSYFHVYEIDEIAGGAAHCNTLFGSSCREELILFLDCPGDIQARTEMDLTDCGGSVTHEFWIGDLPGELGDPWFTAEYRPFAEMFDVDALIRAPLAYCANGQAEHLGVTYPLTSDSSWNMFCAPVDGFSDEICAVETGDSARLVFNLSDLGIPALGYGDGNCDTIKLSYDLCMVCPGEIKNVLNYDIRYDWRYAGGHNYSETDDYLCNQLHSTNPDPYLENSICDELGQTAAGANWFDLMMFYDTLMGSNDVISETFVLMDMRDPLTPVSITNNGPNLIASTAPGVSIEIQEVELCNPDVDDNATGVGMSVTIPSAVRLEDVYTDAAGTSALVKQLISDDGINKIYNITLPTDNYIPNECNTFYVGTTLLFCPDASDAPPKICVGTFSGCAPETVKAALAGSGGCAGSEICYTYIFGEVGLQTEWFGLPSSFPLCDTITMNVLVKNVKDLVLLNLVPMFDLPPGVEAIPGSWQVAYPGGPTTFGPWVDIPTDPDLVSGNTYSYSDDNLWNASIDANGLQGVSTANTTADSNKVSFRFRIATSCDEFTSGSKSTTETVAIDPCSDEVVSSGLVESMPLIVSGANPNNYAQLISLSDPEIINCEASINNIGITAINIENKPTSDSVLICVTFPEGLDYQPGTVSFTSPSSFSVGVVTETPIGTSTEVCFGGPSMGPYGSFTMNFDAKMDPAQECGDVDLLVDIKSYEAMVACSPGPPTTCGAFVQNNINNRVKIELAPPFIAEDIEVFTECPTTDGNAELYYEFNINHNGADAVNQQYTVNFYEDVDGNQSINPNIDNLIGTENGTFSVNDGASVFVNGSIDVPDAQSCPILFEVAYNTTCTCDRTEEYFSKVKFKNLRDYEEPIAMCVGDCINIELCDFVTVNGDSVKGASDVVYDLEVVGKHTTLPSGGGFLTYETLTNDSHEPADSNFLSRRESSEGDAFIIAHFPIPVSVSSFWIGGGQLTGWSFNLQVYTSVQYELYYSHDGSTWIDSGHSFTGPNGDFTQEEVLNSPITAQHWRLSSKGVGAWWTTSEFRLEGDDIPFSGPSPVSVTGNTATICLPDGVGIDAPWQVVFTSGVGACQFEEKIEIWNIDTLDIDAGDNEVYCEGNPCIDLIGVIPQGVDTANVAVQWSPSTGIANPNSLETKLCPTVDETYTLTVTFPGGCVKTDTVVVDYRTSVVTPPATPVEVCDIPSAISATAGYAFYEWYEDLSGTDVLVFTSSSNTFVAPNDGTYTVKAYDGVSDCPVSIEVFDYTIIICTCEPALGYTQTGCLDNGDDTFTATFDVTVNWIDVKNPGEDILVYLNGALAQTLDRNTVTPPHTFSINLDADGLGKDTIISVFETTVSCADTIIFKSPAPCPAAVGDCSSTTGCLGGTAFEDFNCNGTDEASEAGIQGIQVVIYDCTNTAVDTVWTDSNGDWQLCGLTDGEAYRVEFILPESVACWASPTHAGGDNGTDVQFLTAPACTKFGLSSPKDYCVGDPYVIIPCFSDGAFNGGNSGEAAIVKLRESADGHDFTGTTKTGAYEAVTLATHNDVGAVYGVAWQPTKGSYYLSSFHKRYVGFGPDGPDAIYQYDLAGNKTGVINLDALLAGSNTAGSDVHDFTPAGISDPHPGEVYDLGTGDIVLDGVGKRSFGDIEMSDNDSLLYVVNLFDKKIYALDVSSGNASNVTVVQSWITPDETKAGRHRPFALAMHQGKLWVGSVDENGSNAYVHSILPNGTVFNLELTVPLGYDRQAYINEADFPDALSNWNPWVTNSAVNYVGAITDDIWEAGYPQAILSDIEFADNGDMILGFRDRFGDQAGSGRFFDADDTKEMFAVSAGDILKACYQSGGYVLETGGGSCAGAGGVSPSGPNGTEFYSWDLYNYEDIWSPIKPNATESSPGYISGGIHWETTQGALLQLKGKPYVMTTAMDPFSDYSGGLLKLNNTTGGREGVPLDSSHINDLVGGYTLYETGEYPPVLGGISFGKANGLGDLEAACAPAPLEIGNYVWCDSIQNGIQDACEQGIEDMIVQLYDEDGLLVGQDTTENGNYYFNQNNVDTTGITVDGSGVATPITSWSGMQYSTKYYIVFGNSQYDNGTELFSIGSETYQGPTIVDAGTNDNIDSDVDGGTLSTAIGSMPANLPVICMTTDAIGCGNHRYDFGILCEPCEEIENPITERTICSGELVDTISVTTTFNNPDSIAFVYFTTAQTDSTVIYTGGTGIDTIQIASSNDTVRLLNTSGFINNNADNTPDTFFVYAIAHPTPSPSDCRPYEEIKIIVNACDWGDLPDVTAGTNLDDYQTTNANNGPVHVITPGLSLGTTVDGEPDGQPSTNALGDGADEDGLTIFPTLDISPGSTFRLPLGYTNTTGMDAHIEAWIDWNANGEFDAGEMVFDDVNPTASVINVTVPVNAVSGEFLGVRIRISNEDNMTPYGRIESGEVEDYLIGLDCETQICIPMNLELNRK